MVSGFTEGLVFYPVSHGGQRPQLKAVQGHIDTWGPEAAFIHMLQDIDRKTQEGVSTGPPNRVQSKKLFQFAHISVVFFTGTEI